ncbi:hypothetical protein IV59_GL000543 [Paucilactobacillus hokkaidonensis]|nr:hypothetical protein IV59_GL000543 [Paucilactobacillus hokkaidonensis]
MVAILERQNQDVLIQLIGGDVPHYGVVMSIDNTGNTETIRLPSRPGHVHQEKILIEQVAGAIKPVLQNNAIIVSGMHVNDISTEQMHAAIPMAQKLGARLAVWLKQNPVDPLPMSFAKKNSVNNRV